MSATDANSGPDYSTVMAIEDIGAAIDWQAEHAEINAAPCTARIVRALKAVLRTDTLTGRRIAGWEGLTLKDAMPLRVAGGLHHLLLSGQDDRLARVYSGQIADQQRVDALVCELVEQFDAQLLPWLDGPPQTNEAGRAASIMGGLLWLAQRTQRKFELFELGASAGVITMLDRYRFTLGETVVGPANSPMHIAPEWKGASPPAATEDFEILSVAGCDLAPIDLSDADSALKLKSYVWPDAPGRMARIDAAIELASNQPPVLTREDAGAFVKWFLAQPQAGSTARVMFHSIMWQYMPESTQAAITAQFEAAGELASSDRPLGWVSLETDPKTFRHELKVRLWDGGDHSGETVLLSHAHPHGAWVEWSGG
ncbi:DUF2332 domain-containing protein [Erythrobacter sp. MTPC3]|uniref:DUF2332 domain-containing protein n=1 Tax=Erythrobacter sp. MTPC3 TaxID=3056564 RepID=UPI0036F1FC7A